MSVESAIRLEKNPAGDKENIALLRGRGIPAGARPLTMGILNLNGNPFSRDAQPDAGRALDRAIEIVAEGADILDVCGESDRTDRAPVSEDEEWRRIAPFFEKYSALMEMARPRDCAQIFPPLVSVNTCRTGVAARALRAGCDLLNDTSALPDATRARLCAERGTALLIMHPKLEPKVLSRDVMAVLEQFFESKIAAATAAGLPAGSIVLDPGIDFANLTEANLRILRELPRLARFGCPILLSASRKCTAGRVPGIESPPDLDTGTISCLVAGALRGAAIFRVSDVSAAWLALRATTLVK